MAAAAGAAVVATLVVVLIDDTNAVIHNGGDQSNSRTGCRGANDKDDDNISIVTIRESCGQMQLIT